MAARLDRCTKPVRGKRNCCPHSWRLWMKRPAPACPPARSCRTCSRQDSPCPWTTPCLFPRCHPSEPAEVGWGQCAGGSASKPNPRPSAVFCRPKVPENCSTTVTPIRGGCFVRQALFYSVGKLQNSSLVAMTTLSLQGASASPTTSSLV